MAFAEKSASIAPIEATILTGLRDDQKRHVIQMAQNQKSLTRKQSQLMVNLSDFFSDSESNADLAPVIFERVLHELAQMSGDGLLVKLAHLFLEVFRELQQDKDGKNVGSNRFKAIASPLVQQLVKVVKEEVEDLNASDLCTPVLKRKRNDEDDVNMPSTTTIFADSLDGKNVKKWCQNELNDAKKHNIAQESREREERQKRNLTCASLRIHFDIEQLSPFPDAQAGGVKGSAPASLTFSVRLDKDRSPDMNKCKNVGVLCERKLIAAWRVAEELHYVEIPKSFIDSCQMMKSGASDQKQDWLAPSVVSVHLVIEPIDSDVWAPLIVLPVELPLEPHKIVCARSYMLTTDGVTLYQRVCTRLQAGFGQVSTKHFKYPASLDELKTYTDKLVLETSESSIACKRWKQETHRLLSCFREVRTEFQNRLLEEEEEEEESKSKHT